MFWRLTAYITKKYQVSRCPLGFFSTLFLKSCTRWATVSIKGWVTVPICTSFFAMMSGCAPESRRTEASRIRLVTWFVCFWNVQPQIVQRPQMLWNINGLERLWLGLVKGLRLRVRMFLVHRRVHRRKRLQLWIPETHLHGATCRVLVWLVWFCPGDAGRLALGSCLPKLLT